MSGEFLARGVFVQGVFVRGFMSGGVFVLIPPFGTPHLLPRGGGGDRADPPPAISETVDPMNVKFCRVLETPLKVLEMLRLFT